MLETGRLSAFRDYPGRGRETERGEERDKKTVRYK